MIALSVTWALAADVKLVGTDIRLFEQVPRLREALPGLELAWGPAVAARTTTVVYGDAPSALLASLPATTTVEPLTWKADARWVVALGADVDRAAPPEPEPVRPLLAREMTVLGFDGGRLVLQGRWNGCCDAGTPRLVPQRQLDLPPDEDEDRDKAALTELFQQVRNERTPVLVERPGRPHRRGLDLLRCAPQRHVARDPRAGPAVPVDVVGQLPRWCLFSPSPPRCRSRVASMLRST